MTLLALAALCCPALAADDAALPMAGIESREPQVQNAEFDAITIPRMLSYQGKLTDTMGIPVPDTTYSVRFRLYTQASGGSHYWEETQTVGTEDGLFSVLLGSVTAIPSVPDAGNLYLGMAVAGGAEMAPRLRIVSAAYAYKADSSAHAAAAVPAGTAGGDLAGSYPNPTVDGIRGRAVASTVPSLNQVLKWTGASWTPTDDSAGGPPSGPAGGDLAGTYPNPTVDGLQGRAVAATSPSNGQVLEWNGSNWTPALDDTGSGTVTAVSQSTGIRCTPDPITTTGTVALNTSYTDGRYVNDTGDSIAGRLVAANSRGICFEGRCSAAAWSGQFTNTSSGGGAGCFGWADHSATGYYAMRGSSSEGVGVYGWNNNTSYYAVRAHNSSGSTAPGLSVDGTSYFSGAKTGFVADLCRNSGSEALEPGDVVVVTGCEPAVLGSVPVPLVARAGRAGQTGVIGVVDSRQIVDPAGAEPDDGPTAIGANPAHVRHAPGPVRPGDYLLVATLGAYQGVRVDASFGAVQPGDLLVASPRAGFAMVTDDPQQGTVVGKALAGLDAGSGLVPVMILQQ